MTTLIPLRKLPSAAKFTKGDVFILFGELFGRGYANGLVEEAKKAGMEIIGITVGRRDENKVLRALNDEELAVAEKNLGGKIINIPMEAGFDLDAYEDNLAPAEMLKDIKPDIWEATSLNWELIEKSRVIGVNRFKTNLQKVIEQLSSMIPSGKNVLFAHTMAGGLPRAKIVLVLGNRVFKGKGKRYLESEKWWKSDIGRLSAANFMEVTANTFKHLLDATKAIREKVKGWGGETCYTAYGYHGTEIYLNGGYRWQTYTPYKQGYAKMRLEKFAHEAWQEGIKATVFNCPEIRTNSSDLFAGVELSLFPLIKAIKIESDNQDAKGVAHNSAQKLTNPDDFPKILSEIENYHNKPLIQEFHNFDQWPMENTLELMETMIDMSKSVIDAHKDRKDLVTDYLSQIIVDSSGKLMFDYSYAPEEPVVWLGHDIIAKQFLAD